MAIWLYVLSGSLLHFLCNLAVQRQAGAGHLAVMEILKCAKLNIRTL